MEAMIMQIKKKKEPLNERLARFRKAAGYSQRALAAIMGVPQPIIAYQETRLKDPPLKLIATLAKIYGVTTDELLGIETNKHEKETVITNERLLKRFAEIEKLSFKRQKKITDVIDALIAQEKRELRYMANRKERKEKQMLED